MEALVHRRQQIGQVEIIGAMAPYLSCPGVLASVPAIHWIDNTSACAAVTKGYSGACDSARLVHALHAWMAGAGARVWFEYVPTDANPSDEPSRRVELADAEWAVCPGVVSRPVPLVLPRAAELASAAPWAQRGRAACA